MNRAKLAAAACALLLTAACGGPYSDAAQVPDPFTSRPSSTSTGTGQASARPGNQRVLDGDLTVTVSAPRSFTPTDAAYPRAARAVAFELIIGNESRTVYQPSRLSITAACNGVSARQVVDSTQGYTGFVSTTDRLLPGETMRVVVAFAVPLERADVQLMVQPDAVEGGRVTLFQGTV